MIRASSAFRRWFVNGIVLTIPLVVTLLVLLVVVDFVLGILEPIVTGIAYLWPNEPPATVIQAGMLASLLAFFLVVGLVADYTPGKRISRRVHTTMETIPGVSTVYESVRRASDVLADDDTDQFKEVKLVEFPHDGAYMLGFLTGNTPELIERTTDENSMQTIMIPLGPNPTTNGFVMHIPADHVYDVDMTVEQAARSIATLGVSTEVGTPEEAEGQREGGRIDTETNAW